MDIFNFGFFPPPGTLCLGLLSINYFLEKMWKMNEIGLGFFRGGGDQLGLKLGWGIENG